METRLLIARSQQARAGPGLAWGSNAALSPIPDALRRQQQTNAQCARRATHATAQSPLPFYPTCSRERCLSRFEVSVPCFILGASVRMDLRVSSRM